MTLIFPSENGVSFEASDNTFLLFIDETGEESLNDPNFPIFGFGGAGLPASLYFSNICRPWIYVKEKAFGGEKTRMHAADLIKPTSEQKNLLNRFFTTCAFCRVAAVISDKAAYEEYLDIYNIAVRIFYNRILDVLQHAKYDDIFMIFEDSQRSTKLNKDYFSRYKFHRKDDNGKVTEVICQKFIMSKDQREPGLEVADFVAHTAGTSVRSRLAEKRSKANERKDFKAVFQSADPRLSSFLEITSVETISAE
jgi:hypothetical protein